MKLFEIPMVVTSLVGLCFLAGLDAPPARADFAFGEPVSIQSDFPFLNPATDWIFCFSADELEAYLCISADRPGGYGQCDIWVSKRSSVEDKWGAPENLGPLVNSEGWDQYPILSADGLELYFSSDRPGGYGDFDLYVARRATRTSPWEAATNLGPKVNSAYVDAVASASPDGLELYILSDRPGGYGGGDFYVSRRATRNDPWGDPVNVGPVVNSPGGELAASFSPDGLLMFFGSDRPGEFSDFDGYVTRRASPSAPWQPAVNLGPIVNKDFFNWPSISADGSTLYILYEPNDWSTMRTYEAPILPIVDFNADKKVDLVDLVMLINDWGKSKSPCDIGPYAWGDGKVDIEDLKVFMTYYEKAHPPKQP